VQPHRKSATDLSRSRELRAFLQAKRARILPRDVGVPITGRRRLPGLTREDVAHLAGVSFKWYGRFESGAASGVSRRFLERISAALRLTAAERKHLYSLAGFAYPEGEEQALDSSGSLGPLLEELGHVPAAVFSSTFDVLSYNATYDCLFKHSRQPAGIEANALWRLFMDPAVRGVWSEWETVARRAVAELRCLNRTGSSLPMLLELQKELSKSVNFENLWAKNEVADRASPCPRFDMQVGSVGRLTFEPSILVQNESPKLIFLALIPTNDAAREHIRTVRRSALKTS